VDDTKLHLPFLFVMRFLMSTSKKPLVDSPFFESTTRRIIPISNWLVSGLRTDYNQVINLIVHLGDLLPAGLLATCDSFPDPPQLNTLWASRRQLIQPRSNTGPTLCELPVQDQCFLSTYPPHQKEHTTQKKCICLSWLWGRTGFKFSTSSPIKWCNYGTSPTSKAIWG